MGIAGRGPVPPAIVRCAEVGAAFKHFTGNGNVRLSRVKTGMFRPATGIVGTQHAFWGTSGWRGEYQSVVHSQTLPIMSSSPYPFGGNASTGDVRS